MKNIKKTLVALATCSLTLSGSAFSIGSEVETIYYETAAKQNVVGAMLSGCGIRPLVTGTRTPYYTTTTQPCVPGRH